jgi:hypothetical protein
MSRCLGLLLVAVVASVGTLAAAERAVRPSGRTYSFQDARQTGSIDRVAVMLEVRGTLKVPKENKIERPKMSVDAKLAYDERTLEMGAAGRGPIRAVRHYDLAEATIRAGDEQFTPRLRPERSLMAVRADDAKVTLFSPRGQLTWEELDLVDLPVSSLLVERFLPDRAVTQGETWTHSDDLITAMLRLDRIGKNEVQSKLAEVTAKSAIIEMAGRVEGAINGVTTRIELKAKYRFSFQTRRIDWLGLLVHEDRDIGHVGPGLEIVAKLQMQRAPRESSKAISDKALAGLSLEPSDALTQLVFEPVGGGWRCQHDRCWFLTGGDRELAFLRMVDRGDFIAQCNVATLAQVKPGRQATLEEFQQDIQKALGDEFGDFVSASQKANEQNYRVLRVVARGTVSGMPIEWHYYLVADEHGRQVTFTFSVEQPLVERLRELDRQIVASLRFDAPRVAMKDKAAP